MVGTSIQVLGLKEVEQMLKEKSKEMIQRADEAVKQSVFFIEGEVKESIAGHRAEHMSVDTGRFLNSVKGTKTGLMQGKVESNVGYGQFLEYGTSKIEPRAHFRNTVARNELKVKEMIQSEVKKISN